MRISGERQIASDRQRVWAALNDPAMLQAAIPGCESMEADGPDRYRAVAEVKIGPIGARFNAVVAITDKNAPESYRLTGEGKGGIAGTAKGAAAVRLAETGPDATLLSYDVDAEVGGRLAQLGGPIIKATADRLAAEFFGNLEAQLTGAPDNAGSDPMTAAAAPAVASRGNVGPAATGSYPYLHVLAVILALLSGFALAVASKGAGWLLAVAILAVLVFSLGWALGRRGGG